MFPPLILAVPATAKEVEEQRILPDFPVATICVRVDPCGVGGGRDVTAAVPGIAVAVLTTTAAAADEEAD